MLGVKITLAIAALDRKSTRLNSSHANISYAVFCLIRHPHRSTLFPYTTLFRSDEDRHVLAQPRLIVEHIGAGLRVLREHILQNLAHRTAGGLGVGTCYVALNVGREDHLGHCGARSEEHTSELQSRQYLVCRLLLDPSPTSIYTLSLHDALPI